MSLPACTWQPLRSSNDTVGSAVRVLSAAFAPGTVTAAVGVAAGFASVPVDQLTTELGCTLTGPAGSTALTVSSSEVQVIPTAVASAALACDVEVPGPRSRGSSDTVSPTVITLPSSACRSVAGGTERDARFEPVTVTDRAPYTVTGATITAVSSRRPALDSVTSSSSAVPGGVSDPARPTTADGGARAGQRDRVPFPDAQGGNGFGVQADHSTARVRAEVFSRAVSES